VSVTHEVTVWCDDEECVEWVQGANGLATLRRQLKRQGWLVAQPGGRDICCECKPHTKKKEVEK